MISVICPVFNEEHFIKHILDHFISVKPAEKELILIDGGSTDRTTEIIQEYIDKYSNIILLHNPKRYVPFALNMAITAAKGDPIIRIDAHTEYADDYYEKILEVFETTGADIAGGGYNLKYKTAFQQNVGSALSSKWGTGGSEAFNVSIKGYSDQVAYGAWRKYIFEKTGYFDESLLRNQDDEFHYRAKSAGFKIYRDPSIKLWYYPRSSLSGLFSQYFQYGDFKPLSLSKSTIGIKIRNFFPSALVLYFLLSPLAVWLTGSYLFLLPVLLYVIITLILSFKTFRNLQETPESLLIFFTLHFSYGLGFLKGFSRLFKYYVND